MEYSIRELSELAGVSARTLRYYDEINLLKPLYVNKSGYRYYGEKEVALLQQILFYRERGFDLKQIQKIIYQDDFDIMMALGEHLQDLKVKKQRMESLIQTVEQTILSMKGECEMSDKDKFKAFKEKMVKENEERYGAEIREKYGNDEVNESNRKMLNMSEEQWEHFSELGVEINERLKAGVLAGVKPESEAAKEIVKLHKEWLQMTWKQYSVQAHQGVAMMYLADERFQEYYDKEVKGCAELLTHAVEYWAEKI